MYQAIDVDDIDRRLEEWGRWVVERTHQGHCGSIEHRYRLKSRADSTPTGWGDWGVTPVNSPPPRVNPFRALEVEQAMRHIPALHRKALKLIYINRLDSRFAAKRCAIPHKEWESFLADAQRMVVNALRLRLHLRKNQSKFSANSIPVPAETSGAPDGSASYGEKDPA